MPPEKLSLARLPTPLWRHDALDALVGTEIWVKRDDMSAGPEAGNKIRKLVYLFAEALQRGATTVVNVRPAKSVGIATGGAGGGAAGGGAAGRAEATRVR